MEVEILGFSVGSAVPQTSDENHVWFYARRLLKMDWILVGLAAMGSFRSWRSGRRLLAVWVVVGMALVLGNQYRNVAYLLPIIPALCWMAAEYSPGARVLVMVAAMLTIRVATPKPSAPIPSARVLADYAAQNGGRELILIDPDDQFLATTLPIRTVRYCFLGNEADYGKYALNFRKLGIALTVDEFLSLDERLYRERLREFDLDSSEPIGTVIVARDEGEARRLMAAKPEADFLWKGKLILGGR